MATIVAGQLEPGSRRADGAISANAWKIAVLIISAGWLLAVGVHHEPWVDEAQAWLIARDSGLRELLVERVRYEGTPGLWHLTLWGLIRAGLPYSWFFTVPAAFALLGGAVILWRAPFPAWLRAAIVSSYFFAYQYGVVARSYSVDLFLVPLAAAWFSSRVVKPVRYALVLGLIANLNAHSFLPAAILGAEQLVQIVRSGRWRDRRSQTAVLLVACLGLFAIFCAWQPADNGFRRDDVPAVPMMIVFIKEAFVDRATFLSTSTVANTSAVLGFAITVIALWPSLRLIAQHSQRWTNVGILAALVGFSALTYASSWHSGLLYLFLIFALWVSWPADGRVSKPLAAGWMIISGVQLIAAAQSGIWDLKHVYSPSRQAAAMIGRYRAERPDVRVAAFGFKSFAMQPYWSRNGFSNYKDGTVSPAWLDWRVGETWDPYAGREGWLKMLADKPDLIVASVRTAGRSNLPIETCEAGYRIEHRFTGAMIWRGIEVEDETLLLLERQQERLDCPTQPKLTTH